MSDPKIYIYALPHSAGVIGLALAEDGTALTSHISSNDEFARHDMGITSDWKHDVYKEHYPGGYELEWVPKEELAHHSGFQAAWKKNQEQEEAQDD